MYFNVNFNVLFKFTKVHLLLSELYIYQNARCNNKNLKKYELYCLNLYCMAIYSK